MLDKRSFKIKCLEVISAATAMTSTFLIASGYPKIGFELATLASMLFAFYNWITKQYALMVMSIVYLIIEILGILHWSKV